MSDRHFSGFSILVVDDTVEGYQCFAPGATALPDFYFHKITHQQCVALNTQFCPTISSDSNGCRHKEHFQVDCPFAKVHILAEAAANIGRLNASRPIQFILFDTQTVPWVFDPVRMETVHLSISACVFATVTSKLPDMDLPNLVYYGLYNCYTVVIRRADFANNCKLRWISFTYVTFESIESDTFTNLIALQHLELDSGWRVPLPAEATVALVDFYCGCSFHWLRTWIGKNSLLLEAKKDGEMFRIGSLRSEARVARNVLVEMDCATPNVSALLFDHTYELHPVNHTCQ